MKKRRPASETRQIIAHVKNMLKDEAKPLTPAERLKALEMWTKALAIQHKIEGTGKDGSFFDND